MKIVLVNETEEDVKKLNTLLRKVFSYVENTRSMSIVFVTKEKIQQLNKDFRQLDKPTDVLSFENDDLDEQSKKYLGDIFICLEIASTQAVDYLQSTAREVIYLALHGYFHLLGLDHQTQEEELIMHNKIMDVLSNPELGGIK